MNLSQAIAEKGKHLSEQELLAVMAHSLAGLFEHQKVLVLIPDHTRTLPLPFLFKTLVKLLADTRQLDFMVALGTHPALPQESIYQLVGINPLEARSTYGSIGLFNHAWDDPSALVSLGFFEQDEIRALAGNHWHASLPDRVNININRAAFEYDQIIILGPTFPHEVAGFSGGAKYLFPGISGAEMINATHWLGALAGVVGTIGLKNTPVREMIHAAALRLTTPVTLVTLVMDGHNPAGIFIGDLLEAWSASADLSADRNVIWSEQVYQRVLSCAPPMYDELWTAAKAMYKLEPVVAPGGELIIYAPHLDQISRVHGKYIYEIGYHILPYFLQNWQHFKNYPLGVLAHSTHVSGSGRMECNIEKPNVKVTLASQISAQDCQRLNLGYLDPASIHMQDWQGREKEGVLFVPRAGEVLYRTRSRSPQSH